MTLRAIEALETGDFSRRGLLTHGTCMNGTVHRRDLTLLIGGGMLIAIDSTAMVGKEATHLDGVITSKDSLS